VGSTMYVSAVVTGYFINQLHATPMLGLAICLLVGIGVGAFNAFTITKLGIVPFIATLTTMVAGRGLGLAITKSTAVDFPESITLMSTRDVLGFIPLQILAFLLVVALAAVFLRFTAAGRQLYAVGNDLEAARKAGIRTRSLTASTYVICGLMAALGGFISITQLGRVNANFGSGDEFDAIAAAVLGGASLFGGVGTVFPGTLLGTLLIQMIQAGLVFTNLDLYIQPLVMAAIIFFAVFLDSARNAELRRLNRRHIMKTSETEPASRTRSRAEQQAASG
ncbi:ABC transporter permease, partial [Salinispira pacifica]